MSYLIIQDFKKQIQSDNLQQIIGSDLEVLKTAELQAVEEAYGYLVQKYDTTQEFTDTAIWSLQTPYNATDRVYLDAPAYSATLTYALNSLTSHSGKVYKCTTAITDGEAFNPAKWQLIGDQYDMYYAKYPKPLFNYLQTYRTGDQVFFGRCFVEEQTGGINHDVSANRIPLQRSRIALLAQTNSLAIHHQLTVVYGDLSFEASMHAVVGEHVGQVVGLEQIIDADHLNVVEILYRGTEHHATNAAKAVDADFDSHTSLSFVVWRWDGSHEM